MQKRYQRSVLLFKNSIKSEETFKQYTYYLDRFIAFFKLKDLDSMITMDSDQLQIMIEDYIMHIKKGHSRSAVANPLYALEAFLDINDVQINWRKV